MHIWCRKIYEYLVKHCVKNNYDENQNTEAATRGVLCKKVFLEVWQNSQENICARDSFSIKLQQIEMITLSLVKIIYKQNKKFHLHCCISKLKQ